ncbi:enoyl-CoA hydratase/isomerase family protein [Saccharopolyspora sp. HNM0983]|uniref:Enoyl-CoA hydratase/isomerase family protein n=1 Tax=Saccharopolyspora montiporae TaxID=2781240 RepID=A0A929G083_9PSEU|nr:enoyl-CoA hydratase [Saccharopolyspora sp. HNM0983]MBE9373343.1 enoyl-CoA hydratase/isomerase family protein [Saccharopolyspora sp. HNM0983]
MGDAERHAVTDVDDAGVATVTVRGANSLNIVGTAAIREVTAAISALSGDSRVRVLVLRGAAENAFVGGADIAEMSELDRDSAQVFIRGLAALCEAVRSFPAPVVARISGWCLGAGLELAAACDLRISDDGARFGMPEVQVGIPSVIHAALLPRLVGSGRAASLMLTGRRVDAGTALAWGLVDEVVGQAELDTAVARTAGGLAALPPAALRKQKELLRAWEELPVDRAVEHSVAAFGDAFDTGEPQQRMGEFLQRKRTR